MLNDTDTKDLIGTPVCVHLNLSKGCFVIADKPKGKILAYVDTVTLSDVTFKISEAQRQYCITKQGRWVHAFALGTLVAVNAPVSPEESVKVTYNPFRAAGFHRADTGEQVEKVLSLTFADRHAFAAPSDIL